MGCENCAHKGTNTLELEIHEIKKLSSYNWGEGLEQEAGDFIEVRFKNTRKEYYRNNNKLWLKHGDIVAVEASAGHDIGQVSLTGHLVKLQLKKHNWLSKLDTLKKIYRVATPNDLVKQKEARSHEKEVLKRARILASEHSLEMKISDVEYQGDGTRAIFYYTAEGRVDFRDLIKVYAYEFKIRIEMRQIGSRQEAGRMGGIGSCGRELCCSSWLTNFNSVTADAARVQELTPNMQKLTGQCGKLKCCLMYELDTYTEARSTIPNKLLELETVNGIAYHHKTEVLKRIMYYSIDSEKPINLVAVPVERVKEIIMLNKKGIKVEQLVENSTTTKTTELHFTTSPEENNLERFSKIKREKGNNKKSRSKKYPKPNTQK